MITTAERALQRATPESQGIASSAVLRFVEAIEAQIHELHSFMLLRHGKVVAEGWWSPYRPEYPHMLFSLSKSFTSTAVGLAVSEGHFSIDDPVLSFFPDEAPHQVNEHLSALRVRHLLTMTTGQVEDTIPAMMSRPDGNWIKSFFQIPCLHEPGTHFLYNTGATYLLSAILQKTTGMKLVDYLEPRLFAPLGIKNATWQESPQGINTGGFGLNIKTEDIARFGQLYLQKGLWDGRRILSEKWIEEATSFQVPNGEDGESDWAQGYGYQFWRCRHNAYRGDGAFGQYCIVMPDQDAVLAITSGLSDMQQPLNLVWDILLPAMGAQLPDDSPAQEKLAHKLAGLNIKPVQGAVSSLTADRVSDRSYQADSNDLGIESLSLHRDDSGWIASAKTKSGEERIRCGYGVWAKSQTRLFNEPRVFDPAPTTASGAWTADDTFTMVVRLYETPFYVTVVYRFEEDRLTFEALVNVGFEPPKPMIVTAIPA